MRCLGVDLGARRIGIAVGESQYRLTTAKQTLAASGSLRKDAAAISALAKAEQAQAIVVGIPLNLLGHSPKMQIVCLELADHLRILGWEVHPVDEAMTSIEAGKRLESVYTRGASRKRVDGEAARLILERFFDEQS